MGLTRRVYFDHDLDGNYTEITGYVCSAPINIGRTDWKARVADVGLCTLELRNDDKRFTPDYAVGPYYPYLLPNIPIRVTISDGVTTWVLFQGSAMSITPTPDQYGPLRCTIVAQDRIGELQESDISLPLQTNDYAGPILKLITSEAYRTAFAEGTITFNLPCSTSDTITIGDTTYTFQAVLASAYDVLHVATGGSEINLAAAINAGAGDGTRYATGTLRHPNVVAYATESDGNTTQSSNITVTHTNSQLGQPISLSAASRTMTTVRLYLKKDGAPADHTVKVVTQGADGFPSTTLVDANATATLTAAMVGAAYAWVDITFAGSFTVHTNDWIIIEAPGGADTVNYFTWGNGGGAAFSARLPYVGGVWIVLLTAMCYWIPGLLELDADARGEWGNDIALEALSDRHTAASYTLNNGTEFSGALSDTLTHNEVYFVIAEVTGTPGYDLELTFSGLAGTGLVFDFVGRYQGNHLVNVDAWNGATWDTLGTLSGDNFDALHSYTLTAAHTIAGVVLVRIYHVSPGNINHRLFLDYVYVIDDMSTAADGVVLSGSTLTGGVDGPVGDLDYEQGVQFFEYVGDNWVQGETDALTAVTDVVTSEFGLFWAARDGTLIFRDNHYQFEQSNGAAVLTIPTNTPETPSAMQGTLSKDDIINRAVIAYTPRQLSAVQVVAKSGKVIGVPGRYTGYNPRWRRTQTIITQAGERTVLLPYTDPDTGERSGATELVQPLAATTDYRVYDTSDTSGFEYTSSPAIQFSLALAGSGVQVHIDNGLIGKVYIHNLQVRGKTLEHQDETQVLVEDVTSLTAYGIKPYDYSILYPSDNIDDFATLLGQHFVNHYKDPRYRVSAVAFKGVQTVGGIPLFSLEIGQVIALSEVQTAISSQKFMIIGLDYQLPEKTDVETVTLYLMRLDDQPYWSLGTAGYGELGSTTRLAL